MMPLLIRIEARHKSIEPGRPLARIMHQKQAQVA
jgi:hypothetical protein